MPAYNRQLDTASHLVEKSQLSSSDIEATE